MMAENPVDVSEYQVPCGLQVIKADAQLAVGTLEEFAGLVVGQEGLHVAGEHLWWLWTVSFCISNMIF